MPRAGPKKVQEYSAEVKLAAVRVSRQRGGQVQAVAAGPRHSSVHAVAVAEGRARRSAARGPDTGREGATSTRDPSPPGARARPCAAAGGARPLKKSHPVLGHTKADAFAFINTQRGAHAVTRLCALYGRSEERRVGKECRS